METSTHERAPRRAGEWPVFSETACQLRLQRGPDNGDNSGPQSGSKPSFVGVKAAHNQGRRAGVLVGGTAPLTGWWYAEAVSAQHLASRAKSRTLRVPSRNRTGCVMGGVHLHSDGRYQRNRHTSLANNCRYGVLCAQFLNFRVFWLRYQMEMSKFRALHHPRAPEPDVRSNWV